MSSENRVCDLIANLDRLHTTELGVSRIKRNLSDVLPVLDYENDLINWCKRNIARDDAVIKKSGKNWYVEVLNCEFVINSRTYTIITAHYLNA